MMEEHSRSVMMRFVSDMFLNLRPGVGIPGDGREGDGAPELGVWYPCIPPSFVVTLFIVASPPPCTLASFGPSFPDVTLLIVVSPPLALFAPFDAVPLTSLSSSLFLLLAPLLHSDPVSLTSLSSL